MFNTRWIANIPIARRLFFACIVVTIIPGIVIGVLGLVYIQALHVRGEAVQASTDSVKVCTTQLATLQHMNADLIALQAEQVVTSVYGVHDPNIATIEQNLNNEIITLQNSFGQTLTMYQQDYQISTSANMESVRALLASTSTFNNVTMDQQQTLGRVIGQEWQAYIYAQNQELAALNSNQPAAQVNQLLVTANNKYKPLQQDWQHMVDLAESTSNNVAQVGAAQTNPLIMASVLAALSTIIIVVTVGHLVNLTIARPLKDLSRLTRRISKGDTSARAQIVGRDEISMVASSMNNMLDNIVLLIQQTKGQRDILQAQIEKLVGEVSGIAEGNLRVQAEVTPTTLGILAEFFNYMIRELSTLVVHVKVAAREVENSTNSTFNVLAQLVQTSDMQLKQIAEAAVEVEQMAEFSRQVTRRTHMLSNVAHEAQFTVEKGRKSVTQAIEGMEHIHENVWATANKVQMLDEHSREINNIVVVISNIAQQTNNLAQQAARQATVVGENGKGFAAVAADIQRLAERAKGQVSSIEKIVQSVREDIRTVAVSMQETERKSYHGAKLAQEAGGALESIFGAVEQQAHEITNINQMATHQLQSFSAIVESMQHISRSTQQINMETRETAQSVEYLARLVKQVRVSVEAFKLRDSRSPYSSNNTLSSQNRQRQPSGIRRITHPPLTPVPLLNQGFENELQRRRASISSANNNVPSPRSGPLPRSGDLPDFGSWPNYAPAQDQQGRREN